MDIIIDTDPGGDDAIALMWLASLAHQRRIKLKAVTTAAGNVGARITWSNARRLLRLCALEDPPVAAGDPVAASRDASEIHGEDGLGNLAATLPQPPRVEEPTASVTLLRQAIEDGSQPSSLLAVAPLGNLAQAETSTPGLLRKTSDVFIMGGALDKGNVTDAAEFNFYFDPGSAATVLDACAGARLVTLETSRTLRLDESRVGSIIHGFESLDAARFFQALCRFMAEREARFAGRAHASGFPVHDAATVAWRAYPELFEAVETGLRIDTSDGSSRGRLYRSESAHAARCMVASKVDAEALLQLLGRDLRLLFEKLQT